MAHNLGLDLVRATEAAALACGRWMGSGEKDTIRSVALQAMSRALESIDLAAQVIVGEEGDTQTPLSIGARLGETAPDDPDAEGSGPVAVAGRVAQRREIAFDLALDPIDGTTLVAKGMPNGISVIAAAPAGTLRRPPHIAYMEKIAVGPDCRGAIDIGDTVEANLHRVAFARNMRLTDLTVAMLDRPRHQALASEVRRAGARIMMLSDGDVTGALMACLDWTGVDVMLGVGGANEALLAACALKCLGGELQGRFWPRSEEERRAAAEEGIGADRVFTIDDLVITDDVAFAATGVTDGVVLAGVTYRDHWAQTESLVARSQSGTLRQLRTRHHYSLAPSAVQGVQDAAVSANTSGR
ncbi:MAG: fructose-bisphosphatase class II family protein [Candidatus Dormibacteria bacterium]